MFNHYPGLIFVFDLIGRACPPGLRGLYRGKSEWGWGGWGRGGGEKIYEFQIQIFKFSYFQIFDFRFLFSWKYFRKIMLVRYRGINNKGVLERPGTKWKVLSAIFSTLKFQYFRKVDFLMPCKTKSRENLCLFLRTVRAVTLDTPRPHKYHLK